MEKALTPSFNRVVGTTKSPFDASRSADRDQTSAPRSAGLSSRSVLGQPLPCGRAGTVCSRRVELKQPVQLLERRRNVVVRAQSVDQMGGGVDDLL